MDKQIIVIGGGVVGCAVARLLSRYEAKVTVLVIYDDIDIPQGTVRIRPNGSAGTHNGMRSIVAETGTEDFPRIRVGVGQRGLGWNLARCCIWTAIC